MVLTDQWIGQLANALNTRFDQEQVNVIRLIMSEMVAQGVTDKKQQAYVLGTAYHECGFHSIKERKAPVNSDIWKLYQCKYWPSGFYGRGIPQLTWEYNYRKFSPVVGIDLVKNPDAVLDPAIGAKILVYGMRNGSFTALKLSSSNRLSRYLGPILSFWISARKIINGSFMADKVKAKALAILPLLT